MDSRWKLIIVFSGLAWCGSVSRGQADPTWSEYTARAGAADPAVLSQPRAQTPLSPSSASPSDRVEASSPLPRSTGKPSPLGGSDANAPAATSQPGRELTAAKVIARVGDQVILAGDVLGQVNQFLHSQLEKLPPEQRDQIPEEMLEQQRWLLVEQLLPQAIDTKLVYLDFLRSVPEERLPEITDSLYQSFDEKQLPVIVERAHVETAADLDKLLRSFGSSLDHQRRAFAEQVAAQQWRMRHAGDRREISHEDLLAYYHEHLEEYRVVAKAKWEQLSALNSEFPTADEARRAIESMGNEVLGGAPLAAVAKRRSQGPTASIGGGYDWTTKGSLRSEALDAAIFSLPVGELSRVIPDEDGFHIVRVSERQDAGMVPFSTAQASIKEKIREEREEAAVQKYVADLRAKYPVSTIFDANEQRR